MVERPISAGRVRYTVIKASRLAVAILCVWRPIRARLRVTVAAVWLVIYLAAMVSMAAIMIIR